MIREIKDGILYFDGCSTLELAQKFGTPLYVMSETSILEKFDELRECFLDKYPNTRVAYACKAFCSMAMIKLCEREGMCIDVVSGGELFTAISAGFPAERIEFNGNNKLYSELEMAIDYGIGRIIIDSPLELKMIEEICEKRNKRVKVLYRITPGIKADSHDYIVTGKKDSKFGFPIDEDVLYPELERAIDSPYVEFMGLHFHIGSQILDNDPYLQAVEVMLSHIKDIREKLSYEVKEINLGGGFGAVYTDEEKKPYSYFIDPIMARIQNEYKENNLPMPSIVIEPGRSIVAEAGMSLYTVGNVKEIRGVRKYAAVDGGMPDNIRPALYQCAYDGMVANKADLPNKEKVTVCGKCCESGDILIRDCCVPENISRGDLFAVFSTGAYGYSMASNYNSNPIPAVVLVKQGISEIIVKRQSYDEIIERNLIPQMLK